MLRNALLAILIPLGACASSPDYDHEPLEGIQVRASGGASLNRVDAKAEFEGATERDDATGDAYRGRLEVSDRSDLGPRVGLLVEFGQAEFDAVDRVELDHALIGFSVRDYFSEDRLRPYAELRAGYRHTWARIGDERADGPGVGAGLGLGLEYDISSSVHTFVQLDYDFGYADVEDVRFLTHDLGATVGLGVSF